MKILVLSDLYPPDVIGGYELGCCQAVDALRARGHDVRVLTTVPRAPVATPPHVRRVFTLCNVWEGLALEREGTLSHLLLESESNLISAHNVYALIDALAEFAPDVVYVWMLVGIGGLGLMACLQYLGQPWVWHLMDCAPLLLCYLRQRVVPALVREVNRQLHGHYLACSQQVLDEIEGGGVRLNGTIEVVPNWVVGPRCSRRSAYLPGGRLRIVSAGQIRREKGMDLVIESAALLLEQGYDRFSIDLYGRAEDPYFANLIRKYALEDHVALKGPVSQAELLQLYRDYDVFAFPTHAREPFGFAPLEAASRGCVPLISRQCGISEWLVSGVHCLKVERSSAALARTFARILDGAIDLEPIGRRAGQVIQRDHHVDTIVPMIERALERASRTSRAAAGAAADAYRLAILAEKLNQAIIHEVMR